MKRGQRKIEFRKKTARRLDCPVCEKKTEHRYNVVLRHSECVECGTTLHYLRADILPPKND